MINIIEELLAIENQAGKILKKNSDKNKIFAEILEGLKKEIESKINIFFEDEINKYEKKNSFRQKKRLHEIQFRADKFISDMEKEFNNKKEKWLSDYFKKLLEDCE